MKGSQSGKKRIKAYYIGAVLALLWLVLPVAFKSILYRTVDLFHAPVQFVAAKGGEIQDNWALRLNSKNHLIAQTRTISRELANSNLENQRLKSSQNYLNRLERLLMMQGLPGHHSVYARIVRRDTSAWFETIQIDKGSQHDLQVGHAVVADHGLVGRITEVHQFYSTVTLVTSPTFRVTVNTANDDRPIAYSGKGQQMFAPLDAFVQHIPQDIVATEKDPVALFTSGLGEGIPEGIYVGDLITVESEVEGLFQKGNVRMKERLRSLKEVAVLIPLEQTN